MHFDIFNNDAFSLSSLSLAMVNQPHVPSRINSSGLFSEEGISTLYVDIESIGNTIRLVPTVPRGGVPTVPPRDRRQMRSFKVVHLPQQDAIYADAIQGVRKFGTEDQLAGVQDVVNGRLRTMRQSLDVTMEYQRMGAIKGQILDADGTTVLFDLFQDFGVTQNVIDMALDNDATDVKQKALDIQRAVEDELGGLPVSGQNALCSPEFFDALTSHPAVEAAYERWQEGAFFRNQQRDRNGGGGFEFGGIYWEEYRGKVGSTRFIAAGEAYVLPQGVPNLFKTYYAPADYIETVNTIGLPYYAKQWVMPGGKGVHLESQSNPLHLNTRPRAVVKVTI